MRRRRLLWQLYASYLLITLGALAAVLWYGSDVLASFQRTQTQDALEARARLAVPQVTAPLRAGDAAAVNALCAEFHESGKARFTVMRPDGVVLGDSDEDPARMENHAQRPEMAAALDGRMGMDVRHSVTLQQDMMYVAVPVMDGGRVIGVARASVPLAGL